MVRFDALLDTVGQFHWHQLVSEQSIQGIDVNFCIFFLLSSTHENKRLLVCNFPSGSFIIKRLCKIPLLDFFCATHQFMAIVRWVAHEFANAQCTQLNIYIYIWSVGVWVFIYHFSTTYDMGLIWVLRMKNQLTPFKNETNSILFSQPIAAAAAIQMRRKNNNKTFTSNNFIWFYSFRCAQHYAISIF